MAKASLHSSPDVLVLGDHPSAYFAAALLKNKSRFDVLHATIPDEALPERLVLVNPAAFDLHPLLSPLRRKLDLTTIYGLSFLADDPATRSEFRGKSTMSLIGGYREIRNALNKIAAAEGVEFVQPKNVQIHRIDEKGLQVTLGKHQVHPKVLVLAGKLPTAQEKLLGVPESWGQEVVHRYTFVRFKGKAIDTGPKALVPMSLDLKGKLYWAWAMTHNGQNQIAVEQPIESIHQIRPLDLLGHWCNVLRQHGTLNGDTLPPLDSAQSMDLPMAGALAHEGLANRTLLIGPAGGFYSASGEDIYPNLWSAVFAADAIKKAVKERHLQDALQPYRHKWRTTLGDYLRGPQQNLRFLLPLVYRNQVMTTRLCEAILQGKGMVR